MASSLFGNRPPMQRSNPTGMIGQIKQFAGLVRGKGDPKQMVMTYMQQNGISQGQLDATMQQAQEIAQMMGMQ